MPRERSRQSDNGTRNASCSFVSETGVFEMVPSAAQNCGSVQFIAAGHAAGGKTARLSLLLDGISGPS